MLKLLSKLTLPVLFFYDVLEESHELWTQNRALASKDFSLKLVSFQAHLSDFCVVEPVSLVKDFNVFKPLEVIKTEVQVLVKHQQDDARQEDSPDDE